MQDSPYSGGLEAEGYTADDYADDGVERWELKRKNLEKGLGAETHMDDVRYIIEKLCDHPVLSRTQERALTDALAESRRAFLQCISLFPLSGQNPEEHKPVTDTTEAFECYAKLRALLQEPPDDARAAESVLGESFFEAESRFVELKKLYKKFEHKRAELLQHNQRLVMAFAKRYRNMGLPLADLFGHGNTGLIRAADKFEPERGNKFGTYAGWWIRQGITRALTDTSRLIRLTPDTVRFGYALRREERRFIHAHHRKPTESELADILCVSQEELKRRRKELQRPVSLQAGGKGRGDGEDFTLEHGLTGDGEEDVSQRAGRQELSLAITAAFERLAGTPGINPKDIVAYRLFKGLDDGQAHALKDVAAIMGKSNGVVRQMIQKVHRALANDKELRKMAGA